MTHDASHTSTLGGPVVQLLRRIPADVWVLGLMGIAFYFVAKFLFLDYLSPGFHFAPAVRFWVPCAFGVAALYAWVGHLRSLPLGTRQVAPVWLAEFAMGIAAVLYIVFFDPIIYVDDVGFILRYLDNFQQGCFYCYNIEDGPVFGISSFIYGLLAGGLNWLHIMQPETSINFLTYTGTFTTVLLLLRILRQLAVRPGAALLLVLVILSCGKSVISIFNSGMESPVHLSIVLAAFLFFLQKKDRWMWLFLALATISKLDVVPLVLVVGFFWLVENFQGLKHISWRNPLYRNMVLFGIVPIFLWIGFALLVFGSPLPQSAYAKVYFHNHAKGGWFPFLDHFVKSDYRRPYLYVMLTLMVIQLIFALLRRRGGRQLVFGMSFIGTMTLYYFYNPGERMQWYYTLPETLMFTQLVISVYWLLSGLGKRWTVALVGLVVGFTFLLGWSRQKIELRGLRSYEYTVETERMRIGEYLGTVVTEDDTLLAGHGLNARHAKGYVIDQTGLNSRLMTQFERKTDSVLAVLKPKWIVMHGWKWEIPKINKHPYVLDTSFYDISGRHHYPTWRVFKRVPTMAESEAIYPLFKPYIQGEDTIFITEKWSYNHVKANSFRLERPLVNPKEQYLSMGIVRQEKPFSIRIRDFYPGEDLKRELNVEIPAYEGRGKPRTFPLKIPLYHAEVPDTLPKGKRFIHLDFSENGDRVEFADPIVAISR